MLLQKKAAERLNKIGMPTKEMDAFRYVKLRAVLPIEMEDIEGSFAITGALNLQEAIKQFSSYFQERERIIEKEKDPFALLNCSKLTGGSFLYIPPKKSEKKSATLTLKEARTLSPRLYISLGKEASLHLTLKTELYMGLVNSYIDIHLEEGATLTLNLDSSDASSEACHFEAIRITQKRNSSSKITLLTNGSKTSRFSITSFLEGEGASSDIAGLFETEKNYEAHAFLEMNHLAPHTHSNQLFKHLLRDVSHTSFEGKIFVDPIAQKTEAYQLNSNWLLSDHAKAESKPNLEIFADDVKASHGATFGKPEEEEIFYLRARGFTLEDALNALTAGFKEEILCRL